MIGNGKLVHFSKARKELELARTIDEVKGIKDKAEALRTYARQAGESLEMQNNCAEIKIRAERRIGEFSKELPKAQGKYQQTTHDGESDKSQILKNAGIKHHERYEAIADIPEERFEEHIATTKESGNELTSVSIQRLAKGLTPHVSKNSGENEWYTPRDFIEDIRTVMGDIDLDPASSFKANEIVGAKKIYTKENNGLIQKWNGKVYMNPPYGSELIGKFVNKLCESFDSGAVKQAIVLVNNATETSWFQELAQRASSIVFPSSRIKFLDFEGNPKNTPLQGQALLYLGKNNDKFLNVFSKRGIVVEIRHV